MAEPRRQVAYKCLLDIQMMFICVHNRFNRCVRYLFDCSLGVNFNCQVAWWPNPAATDSLAQAATAGAVPLWTESNCMGSLPPKGWLMAQPSFSLSCSVCASKSSTSWSKMEQCHKTSWKSAYGAINFGGHSRPKPWTSFRCQLNQWD